MPTTVAASLLALIGVFDVIGTIFSGYLTDRIDPRKLLFFYYGLRGLSLFLLPSILYSTLHPSTLVFIIFYGLDWVATVPPTIVLCRHVLGPQRATVVYGWVFVGHQIGASNPFRVCSCQDYSCSIPQCAIVSTEKLKRI
jgi:predicted MFS family arabinose efflux permease